jgi:hypothetical protein
VLDLVIQDVGFHLTHSVKGTDKLLTVPPLNYARMDRTTSYKGTAGALQVDTGPIPFRGPPMPGLQTPPTATRSLSRSISVH